MPPLKLLYLYAGPRKKLYARYLKGDEPNTALVGFNFLSQYGIEARFFENWFTELFRKISFNVTQLPALFSMRNYDAVFSGSGLLTLFIAKYLFGWKKPKWFVYNTYLVNLLKRNQKGFVATLIRKAIFSADGIISPSKAQQNYLASVGLPASKNFYLPYGIDAPFYTNAHTSERIIQEPYIFSAGRDIGRDYKTLIEAVKDLPIKLVIGALPRNFPGITSFPSNVTVQYFPPKHMPSLFKHAAFVVIPTIPEEKMVGSDCSGQYVLLESMTSGKAVITSERTTLPDYFTDGEDGLTVQPENPKALKDAIQTLLQDPDRARRMGEHARTKALAHFTTERFAKDFTRILLDTRS